MPLRFKKHYSYTSVLVSKKLVGALVHNDGRKYPDSVELWGVNEHRIHSQERDHHNFKVLVSREKKGNVPARKYHLIPLSPVFVVGRMVQEVVAALAFP